MLIGRPRWILGLIWLGGWAIANGATRDWKETSQWEDLAKHAVGFVDRFGWDQNTGSCLSELGATGKALSERRYLTAVSRQLYGYALSGYEDARHLKARSLADYLLRNLVEWNSPSPYFRTEVGDAGLNPTELVASQQAYGLTGLLALYSVTHDTSLWASIELLYRGFEDRFSDPLHGGFWERYQLGTTPGGGQPVQEKGYNSTVYVMSSMLFAMAELAPSAEGRRHFQNRLVDLSDIISKHFLDPSTGWIVENFDAQWNPAWRSWQRDGDKSIGIVGHNFQAAWVLLRSVQKRYVTGAHAATYVQNANQIFRNMWERGAIDKVRGGVYNGFLRESSELKWGADKHWWQQAEAILAITLAQTLGVLEIPEMIGVRDQAVTFFFDHFVDRLAGGIHAEVRDSGESITGPKAGQGKASYHETELAHFMYFYAQPITPEAMYDAYPRAALAGGSMSDDRPQARFERALRGTSYRSLLGGP